MARTSLIGQIISRRYRIDSLLGQGGMSAVYKAYDPNLKRVVALKTIHAHLADDQKFITRFEEEATAVAQLRHSNIVQVFDFNHDDNLYYMVQEFIPGETLQERLRRLNKSGRRIFLTEALGLTIQVAEAAGYAHQRGMVHRDIKPANIMIDIHGQAILMDFGIVKIVGGERHTATGAVVGTALYLPPELIRGEVPDPRSDLYSLGVTLFEMLAGKPPFEADSAMTLMMMHLNDPLPDLCQLRPETPPEILGIVEKALAKKRDGRYASMADFVVALRNVLARVELPQPEQAKTQEVLAPSAQEQVQPTPDHALGAPTRIDVDATPQATPDQAPGAPTILTAGDMQKPISQEPASDRLTILTAGHEKPAPLGAEGQSHQPSRVEAGLEKQPTSTGDPAAGQVSLPLQAKSAPRRFPTQWLFAGGAVLIIAVIALFLFLRPTKPAPGSGAQASPTSTQPALALISATTTTPTQAFTPTASPTATATPLPSPTPSPTLSPTPTIPVGVPYAVITGITVDAQNRYEVAYETFQYTEQLPGQHVHFIFNNIPPEKAGRPGCCTWYVYGGPRPFTNARPIDRPKEATQMCILVANPDHSIQLNSGNCFILPDIVVVSPLTELACRAGANEVFPAVVDLKVGELLLTKGISPDEAWWNVSHPTEKNQTCWLERVRTSVSGDISILPLVEPPPLPTPEAGPTVEITTITIGEDGRYHVEYLTQGFTEKLPGTHLHFFFDNVTPEQVGISGGGLRLMYGGPSPFKGYAPADRPAEARRMCVVIANPDHSVILESANCLALPDAPSP